MEKGKTPAPWFVEVNGQKQGPYTSQQIMQLLMDGALKVESRLFDSAADTWKIAADVIPYLEVSAPHHRDERNWQPPPRPFEYKDVHVVPLNDRDTGEVDYFALINHQRKESEKTKALASENQRARRGQNASRTAGNSNLRHEAQAPMVRPSAAQDQRGSLPNVFKAAASTSTSSEMRTAQIPEGKDGILMAEVEPSAPLGLGTVLMFAQRTQKFVQTHKSSLSFAAGLCFVFIGTYGTVRMISERKGREPATVIAPTAPAANPNSTIPSRISMSGDDALGGGLHKISRPPGGLSLSPPSKEQAPSAPSNESNSREKDRDPPQFFSTAEPVPVPSPNPDSNANAAVTTSPPAATDPNTGVVQPPGFVPPPIPEPDQAKPPVTLEIQ